jgi:hypothetical protein
MMEIKAEAADENEGNFRSIEDSDLLALDTTSSGTIGDEAQERNGSNLKMALLEVHLLYCGIF